MPVAYTPDMDMNSRDNENAALKARIIDKTGQCVKCGLCAPHCPTYNHTLNENESGRGRIALMRALAEDRIPLSDKVEQHLDSCLTCRACEAACPSDVQYGEIIDAGRALMSNLRGYSALPTMLARTMRRAWRIKLAQLGLFAAQKTGLLALMRVSGLAKLFGQQRQLQYLPEITLPQFGNKTFPTPLVHSRRGRIGLFLGCVSQWSEKPVYDATIKLLNALGYDVVTQSKAACCGALWQHAGDMKIYGEIKKENQQYFNHVDAIIGVASGCVATLKDDPQNGAKTFEICVFLAEELEKQSLNFAPLDKRIAYHVSCTQRNALQSPDASIRCLQHIPELQCQPLMEKPQCCGAAGLNMLQQPNTADALAKKALSGLPELTPDIITTTNIGCKLHFQAQLPEAFKTVKVLHPVQLLAQQLLD